jgi:hypothetical protein
MVACIAREAGRLRVKGAGQMVKMEGCTTAGHWGRALKGNKACGIPSMLSLHLSALVWAVGSEIRFRQINVVRTVEQKAALVHGLLASTWMLWIDASTECKKGAVQGFCQCPRLGSAYERLTQMAFQPRGNKSMQGA